MIEIILGISIFTTIILVLVSLILLARAKLVGARQVTIRINGAPGNDITVLSGGKLIDALASGGIFLPSACGGNAICGQCRLKILEGGGDLLATEQSRLSGRQIRAGYRLSCQVPVKSDLAIEIPPEFFGVRRWQCPVRANDPTAPSAKELILELPGHAEASFREGKFVQIECPPLASENNTESGRQARLTRTYTMVDCPDEKAILLVRIRLSSPRQPTAAAKTPAAKISSYLFDLKPGDTLTVLGPLSKSFAQKPNSGPRQI
ncbi:MAG: 2Fe-2S iron-sulfur cluster-binding protein [Thermodesulfobacteriota bacterium]